MSTNTFSQIMASEQEIIKRTGWHARSCSCNRYPARTTIAAFLLLLILGWPGLSHAVVTVEIFVTFDQGAYENLPGANDGGGLIAIDGNEQFTPNGVCGMHFENVVAWGWYTANGPIAGLNGGPIPNNVYPQYQGPYAGCDASSYVFSAFIVTDPPVNAERLVVQVESLSDLYFLDASFNEVPEHEWPEEPELPSICETWPELCEPGRAQLTICLQLFDSETCAGEEHALPLLIVNDLLWHTQDRLNVAAYWLRKTPILPSSIEQALLAAQKRTEQAGTFLKSVTGLSGKSLAHLTLAQSSLKQCAGEITQARKELRALSLKNLTRVTARCGTARSLADSLAWMRHRAGLLDLNH